MILIYLSLLAIKIDVAQSGSGDCILEYTISDYSIEEIHLYGKGFSKVNLQGEITHLKKSYPELPTVCRNIIIPDDGMMDYKILSAEYETKRIPPVIPSKGILYRNTDPDTLPYTFDKYYETDSWWPERIVEVYEPFILRDFRGLSIRFNPFQYNPKRGELRIVKRFIVEIFKKDIGGENILKRQRKKIAREFFNIYKNIFLNFNETYYDSISERPGRMLIITADGYNSNMAPFIHWKKKKGIFTKIVNISTIGNNPTYIKNRIQAEYDSTDLVWVLLVGDGNEVAPAVGTVGAAQGADADPVYAYTAGNDYYPDIFVSRFSSRSGNSINIDKQVFRSIEYERRPQGNAYWYHIGLGIASNQNGGTLYEDSTRCNWLRDSLLSYTYTEVNKSYDPWGSTARIKKYIESGTGIINYIGHGSVNGWLNGGGFYINDLNNLNNPGKLPFVISVACQVGNFDGNDCYCEASVTAGDVDQPDGFLVHWGSSIDQSWVPPCIGQEGAVNLLTHDQNNTFGGICFNGACYMIEHYGSTNPDGVEMAQTWHIFGDASVQLRTDVPDSMIVEHNQFVPTAPNDFVVYVGDNDGLTPLRDALVCLWIQSQNPELYEIGYTDSLGYAVFNITPSDSGDTMLVTVTKYNYVPYEGYAIVTNTTVEEVQNPKLEIGSSNLEIYPNPFSNRLDIRYQLADNSKSEVSLKVYDASGRLVKSFNSVSSIVWSGDDDLGRHLPAGVYFVSLESADYKEIKKAVLLR